MARVVVTILSAGAIAACATTRVDTATWEAELRAADAAFDAALQAGDRARFAALVDPDATFYGARTLEGREAVVAGWEGAFFPPEPRASLTWAPFDAVAARCGDLGYTRGHYTLRAPPGGAAQEGTYISIWRRADDGGWRAVVDIGTSPKPAAITAPDVSRWEAIKAADFAPPDGVDVGAAALELVELLASPDPHARDALGYEILAAWIQRDAHLGAAELSPLVDRLRRDLFVEVGGAGTPEVFRRSFAALVLSVVAARDVADAVLTEAQLAALVADAARYAAAEDDYRGHLGAAGWAHAAAHTADLLKFLARNPRVGQVDTILDAIASIAIRRHGHNLHHGEDGRLARPVIELLRRDLVSAARARAFLEALVAPLKERGEGFDAALYAAQRNARNLLFTLFVQLSAEAKPTRSATAALAALTKILFS